MSKTFKWKVFHTLESGLGVEKYTEESATATGDFELPADIAFTESASNATFGLPVDSSRVESLLFEADTPVTIYTNNPSTGTGTTAPDDTITLSTSNNNTFHWPTPTGVPATPLSADITKLYLTSGGSAGTLKVRLLMDKDDS